MLVTWLQDGLGPVGPRGQDELLRIRSLALRRQAAGDAELLAENDDLVMDVPGLRDPQGVGRDFHGTAAAVGLPRLRHDEPLHQGRQIGRGLGVAAGQVVNRRSGTSAGPRGVRPCWSARSVRSPRPTAIFRFAAISSSVLPTVVAGTSTEIGSRSDTPSRPSSCMASGSKLTGTFPIAETNCTASASVQVGKRRSWQSAGRAAPATGGWASPAASPRLPAVADSGPPGGCGNRDRVRLHVRLRRFGSKTAASTSWPPRTDASCSITCGSMFFERKRTEPSAMPATMPSGWPLPKPSGPLT